MEQKKRPDSFVENRMSKTYPTEIGGDFTSSPVWSGDAAKI